MLFNSLTSPSFYPPPGANRYRSPPSVCTPLYRATYRSRFELSSGIVARALSSTLRHRPSRGATPPCRLLSSSLLQMKRTCVRINHFSTRQTHHARWAPGGRGGISATCLPLITPGHTDQHNQHAEPEKAREKKNGEKLDVELSNVEWQQRRRCDAGWARVVVGCEARNRVSH